MIVQCGGRITEKRITPAAHLLCRSRVVEPSQRDIKKLPLPDVSTERGRPTRRGRGKSRQKIYAQRTPKVLVPAPLFTEKSSR